MKNILIWLHSKFTARPTKTDYTDVIKQIEKHEYETEQAAMVIDNAIAALDGENGWWCKFVAKEDKECRHVDRNHSTS